MGWELRLYQADNTTYVDSLTPADDAVGVEGAELSFQKVAHDTGGTATVTLDPATATIPQHRQIIRLRLNGVDWAAWRVTGTRTVVVSPSGQHRELVQVSARQLGFDGGIVQRGVPVSHLPATDTRLLGWPGHTYTEGASWIAATAVAVQGWGSAFYTGSPAGWTDQPAVWIGDGTGDDEDAPDNVTWWFRHTFTLAAPAANLVVDYAGDNKITPWFDGQKLSDQGDWQESRRIELGPASAGTHLFAGMITNAPDDGPPGGNPSAGLWTFRDGIEGAVVARSGTGVHVVPYTGPPPSTTDGYVMLALLAENPSLAGLTPSFTATLDSDGTAWPSIIDPWTTQIGADIDDYVRSRYETAVDWEITASGAFHMWVKGGRGAASTVDLVPYLSTSGLAAPATVNLNELEWDDNDTDSFDALLVRHNDGYLTRPASLPATPRWGFLEVDGDAGYATGAADASLALHGSGVQVASIDYVPVTEADWPGAAFDVWDLVDVPSAADPDVMSQQRVRAVTFQVDRGGDARFIVELGSLVQERAELLDRQVKAKAGVGALSGTAASAGRAVTSQARTLGARVSTVVLGSEPFPSVGASGVFQFPFTCRVLWVRVTGVSPSGTTTLQVRKNGSTVATLSMGAAATSDVEENLDVATNPTDGWDWNTTAVGGHTNLVITVGVAPVSP